MTQPPQHTARHGAPTRRTDARALPRGAALKATACVGLVVGASARVAAPPAPSAAPAQPTPDASASSQASAMLEGRGEDAAQRSTARVALAVPTDLPAPVRQSALSAGDLDVTAVKKPAPKPEPKPEPKPAPAPKAAPEPEVEQESEQTPEPADQAPQPAQPRTQAPAPEPTTQAQTRAPAPASSGGLDTTSYRSQAQAVGLGPTAQAVYSAVRSQYPHLTNIGGYRAGDPGDHGTGNAVDVMVGSADGDAVAAFVQQHAGELDVKYVIWKQRIWMPGGSWKPMEDRGDPTQNHFDHVHISVG